VKKNIDSKHMKIFGPIREVSVEEERRLQPNYCTLGLLELSQVRRGRSGSWGVKKCMTRFYWKNHNRRYHLEDFGTDWGIILKFIILSKQVARVRTGFIWIGTGHINTISSV
jgi:hypothetical protein